MPEWRWTWWVLRDTPPAEGRIPDVLVVAKGYAPTEASAIERALVAARIAGVVATSPPTTEI
jgi:hypothetical protein